MSEIDNIMIDLYNGDALVEDDQKLIKSALKLQELIKKYYDGGNDCRLESSALFLQQLIEESENET